MSGTVFVRAVGLVLGVWAACAARAGEPLPRFTEEREAAALHFVRKHCPDLTPLLEELKRTARPAYELQIRETFHVSELLAEIQDDDPKRHELELKLWTAENKALVLVARHTTAKEDERKAVEEQLHALAKELVALEVRSLEHRVEILQSELTLAKSDLAKFRDNLDGNAKQRYEALLERTKKKKP
ncbi:hypothetical protein R5W24_002703 [Gemmata sp. JC717]|uniref:Secreted protein n=1 Tax=Gemmata algarum TaxID=2975278 RepID=A0ABU5F4I3_9BACT|nr:hypothetical protein [Gemmata algarum]MDY3553600.1 hypothetical protein [Gemmata algarum]MDY3562462.1 hypothetical protein [Gemmata algarum]